MSWIGIGGAVGGAVVNNVMSDSKSGGGAGTQTQTKEPWAAAQPWIMNNLGRGQTLQNAYTDQPFSGLQSQAYQNQNNQSAYMHGLVPNLLGQMSGQQVGFDRSNPNLRPNAFNFGAADSAGQQSVASQPKPQSLGLLNMASAAPLNLNANTPQVAQPKAGDFKQQGELTPMDQFNSVLNQVGASGYPGLIPGAMAPKAMSGDAGGFGTFKYGDQPQPGTQQYYDQQQYFLHGGADPFNVYGRQKFAAGPFGQNGNSGDSVGGSPSGDGSGGGNAGVF